MKAFLSYSSQDGNFVDSVANQLGRARVERDKLCFDSGVDIRGAIREALQESDLFVFFASKRSLASFWARFELSEAEDLLREEILRSAVAFTIDESTRPQDLPPWMQRTIVEAVHQPSLAARIVQFHLNRLRGLDVESPLIGREQLLERFAQDVIPAAEMPSPRLVVAYGLDGVGRRSFLKRALKDTLSLNLGPIFSLSPTDGTDRLHALLLEQMGELDSRAGLSAALRTFQSASPLERAAELAQLLAGAASRNWAPAIVDNGSLLNADGTYTEEALALTEALERYPDKLICLIHGRRPGVPGGLRLEGAVYCQQVLAD